MDAPSEPLAGNKIVAETGINGGPRRKMTHAELLGSHSHETLTGVVVHVYIRDGKYLARARFKGSFIGKTLGSDAQKASASLRHILTEMDKGTYVRPIEARGRTLKNERVPEFDLRGLCDAYLIEKRKLRGKHTARTYLGRLAPALVFADLPASRKRWPLARDVNRDFAIDLRAFLNSYQVTGNGRPGASHRTMSARQIHNILSCLRGVFAWAQRVDVRKLPSDYVNPLASEIVGHKATKDALRLVVLNLERRVKLAQLMDLWQLTHLSFFLILPMRPDEVSGLLISDLDLERRHLTFSTRFDGKDFTKGRRSFTMPFPQELLPLLQICRGNRQEGPLLRSRSVFENEREIKLKVASIAELQAYYECLLSKAGPGEINTEQDAKPLFRGLLRKLGGVSRDELRKEFYKLLQSQSGIRTERFYDLRGAVSTEMNQSGIGLLELRYLTGHTTDDIMNQYVSLDIETPMKRYFERIQPLLLTISERAKLLLPRHE